MGLCERFHCLPSDLDKQDAEFLRMISMVDATRAEEVESDGQ